MKQRIIWVANDYCERVLFPAYVGDSGCDVSFCDKAQLLWRRKCLNLLSDKNALIRGRDSVSFEVLPWTSRDMGRCLAEWKKSFFFFLAAL